MISIGDAILKLGVDSTALEQGMKQANQQVTSIAQKMQKALLPMGAAFTGMGAAGLKFVDSARDMNAQLGVTALNLGITTKDMRDLALETTNVTFPLQEVISSFDLLARAGVTSQEEMKNTATAFDTLGDAIGVPAGAVTAKLIPAMKTFNVSAVEMADKTDALTYLFRNTTVSLDDFNRMVGYVTPDLVEMGLTTEDMIAILAELEEQGYSGEVMTREFRKAVTLATKEQIPLNEALGISTENINAYKEELKDATGLTKKYADVANTQYGLMDRLKQKWSELTLKIGSFLDPMEPLLAGLTGMGSVMMTLHFVNIPKLIVSLKNLAFFTKAAAAAQKLLNLVLSMNPFALVAGIIAAVAIPAFILLRKKVNEVEREVTRDFKDIRDEGVTNFEDMALKTEASFRAMAAAGKDYTDEMKEDVVNNFDDMFTSVDDILESRRDAYILLVTKMFKDGTIATEEELANQIAAVHTGYDKLITGFEGTQADMKAAIEAQDWSGLTKMYIQFENEATAILSAGETEKTNIWQTAAEDRANLTTDEWAKAVVATEKGVQADIEAMRKGAQEQIEVLKEQEGMGIISEEVYAGMITAIEAKRDADIQAIREAASEEGINLAKRKTLWQDFVDDLKGLFSKLEFNIPGGSGSLSVGGLQEGGIVRKPTLALLGESGPEMVTPLGNTPAIGNTTLNISINPGVLMGNESEARRFARLIHKYLREETRTRTVGITV